MGDMLRGALLLLTARFSFSCNVLCFCGCLAKLYLALVLGDLSPVLKAQGTRMQPYASTCGAECLHVGVATKPRTHDTQDISAAP